MPNNKLHKHSYFTSAGVVLYMIFIIHGTILMLITRFVQQMPSQISTLETRAHQQTSKITAKLSLLSNCQ